MDEMENLTPQEKVLRYGIEALTDVELLTLFLHIGTRRQDVFGYAQALLQRFGSLYALFSTDKAQLIAVDGLGLAKYAQLEDIAELTRRYFSSQLVEEAALVSPSATREFLRSRLTGEEREIFMVIFLDDRNRVLKHSRLFSGTLSHVEVHPREIVRETIKVDAAAVILTHNHPSGSPEPSQADRLVTGGVVKCYRFMEIRVLDHLVIGHGAYVSFIERDWIQPRTGGPSESLSVRDLSTPPNQRILRHL